METDDFLSTEDMERLLHKQTSKRRRGRPPRAVKQIAKFRNLFYPKVYLTDIATLLQATKSKDIAQDQPLDGDEDNKVDIHDCDDLNGSCDKELTEENSSDSISTPQVNQCICSTPCELNTLKEEKSSDIRPKIWEVDKIQSRPDRSPCIGGCDLCKLSRGEEGWLMLHILYKDKNFFNTHTKDINCHSAGGLLFKKMVFMSSLGLFPKRDTIDDIEISEETGESVEFNHDCKKSLEDTDERGVNFNRKLPIEGNYIHKKYKRHWKFSEVSGNENNMVEGRQQEGLDLHHVFNSEVKHFVNDHDLKQEMGQDFKDNKVNSEFEPNLTNHAVKSEDSQDIMNHRFETSGNSHVTSNMDTKKDIQLNNDENFKENLSEDCLERVHTETQAEDTDYEADKDNSVNDSERIYNELAIGESEEETEELSDEDTLIINDKPKTSLNFESSNKNPNVKSQKNETIKPQQYQSNDNIFEKFISPLGNEKAHSKFIRRKHKASLLKKSKKNCDKNTKDIKASKFPSKLRRTLSKKSVRRCRKTLEPLEDESTVYQNRLITEFSKHNWLLNKYKLDNDGKYVGASEDHQNKTCMKDIETNNEQQNKLPTTDLIAKEKEDESNSNAITERKDIFSNLKTYKPDKKYPSGNPQPKEVSENLSEKPESRIATSNNETSSKIDNQNEQTPKEVSTGISQTAGKTNTETVQHSSKTITGTSQPSSNVNKDIVQTSKEETVQTSSGQNAGTFKCISHDNRRNYITPVPVVTASQQDKLLDPEVLYVGRSRIERVPPRPQLILPIQRNTLVTRGECAKTSPDNTLCSIPRQERIHNVLSSQKGIGNTMTNSLFVTSKTGIQNMNHINEFQPCSKQHVTSFPESSKRQESSMALPMPKCLNLSMKTFRPSLTNGTSGRSSQELKAKPNYYNNVIPAKSKSVPYPLTDQYLHEPDAVKSEQIKLLKLEYEKMAKMLTELSAIESLKDREMKIIEEKKLQTTKTIENIKQNMSKLFKPKGQTQELSAKTSMSTHHNTYIPVPKNNTPFMNTIPTGLQPLNSNCPIKPNSYMQHIYPAIPQTEQSDIPSTCPTNGFYQNSQIPPTTPSYRFHQTGIHKPSPVYNHMPDNGYHLPFPGAYRTPVTAPYNNNNSAVRMHAAQPMVSDHYSNEMIHSSNTVPSRMGEPYCSHSGNINHSALYNTANNNSSIKRVSDQEIRIGKSALHKYGREQSHNYQNELKNKSSFAPSFGLDLDKINLKRRKIVHDSGDFAAKQLAYMPHECSETFENRSRSKMPIPLDINKGQPERVHHHNDLEKFRKGVVHHVKTQADYRQNFFTNLDNSPNNIYNNQQVKDVHYQKEPHAMQTVNKFVTNYCRDPINERKSKESTSHMVGNKSTGEASFDMPYCIYCQSAAKFICSRCYIVSYCSEKCQSNHWPEHSSKCGQPPLEHFGIKQSCQI